MYYGGSENNQDMNNLKYEWPFGNDEIIYL